MKKIFLLTAIVIMAMFIGCKRNTDEPKQGAKDSPISELSKSGNFILVQLNAACNTLGCTYKDLSPLESEGWDITDEGKYIHLEKTIDKVDVVMNCYISDDEKVFHTTCGLLPESGSVLSKLSYAKDAVEKLSTGFMLPTSEICRFQLMEYKNLTSDKYTTITDFDKAKAAINNDECNYSIIWADTESDDFDMLSDGIWSGSVSGLNLGFYMLSADACIVSMEVASKSFYK